MPATSLPTSSRPGLPICCDRGWRNSVADRRGLVLFGKDTCNLFLGRVAGLEYFQSHREKIGADVGQGGCPSKLFAGSFAYQLLAQQKIFILVSLQLLGNFFCPGFSLLIFSHLVPPADGFRNTAQKSGMRVVVPGTDSVLLDKLPPAAQPLRIHHDLVRFGEIAGELLSHS